MYSIVAAFYTTRSFLSLQLTDVSFFEHNPDGGERTPAPAAFREALERNPLRVSYQDGHIEELCLSNDEPTWVVNIKRGILSVFQNNMATLNADHKTREVRCRLENMLYLFILDFIHMYVD